MHALILHRPATSRYATISVTIAAAVPLMMTEAWWIEAALALALAIAGVAAAIDAQTGRIPDRLILGAVAPVAIVVIGETLMHAQSGAVVGALLGVLAFAGPLLVVHLLSPAAIGFGDVKLAAVLGATLGTIDPRAALFALSIAAAGTALFGIVRRRPSVQLGPGLVAGSVAALFVTVPVLEAAATWR